jgi:outer membrane protein assembly factor BamA
LTGSENELVRYGGFARRYQHLGPFALRLNAEVGVTQSLDGRGRPGSDACTSGFDAIGSLRKSVGLGVRWLSPIGPLRFEWGLPLDLKPGEKAYGLEFSIGGSF